MITVGGFFAGLLIVLIGLFMTVRARVFRQYVGDLSELFSYSGLRWLDWNVVGIILMIIGTMTALGIFQSLLFFLFGRLFIVPNQ